METETQSRINFIPCVKWVKRGVAKSNPEKVQLSKEELVQIINETKNKLTLTNDEEDEDTPQDVPMNESANDEFNFERYDEEDESDATNGLGIGSLAELPTEAEDNFSESDDSEKEDDIIKPDDNLILVGRVDGDASIFEVYVYNESEGSLYVHHDFLLPAFPLCFEWLDYEPNQPKGNYCAVGYMTPIIEVWDLDIVNCLEPAFKLGKKPSRKKDTPRVGHSDAVLGLAWNQAYHHILASCSVDKTILLWDIDQQTPSTTIEAFGDKVQCLEWHKLESQTLLAGGCDSTARVFDCRTPEPHQTWQIKGDAERITWNPLVPFEFLVATSTGFIQCFDCRKGEVWSLEGHEKEVTGLAVSAQCPGLMVTTSAEGTVKTWDIQGEGTPKLVHEKNFNMGVVQCLELCPDSPFVVAGGGDKKSNNFTVLDLQTIDVVKHTFGQRELIQLVPEGEEST